MPNTRAIKYVRVAANHIIQLYKLFNMNQYDHTTVSRIQQKHSLQKNAAIIWLRSYETNNNTH